MSTVNRIVVRLQVEGIHRWEGCDIPEVSFLKNNHRHIFYIEAKKKVSHLDRDIEIICLKRAMLTFLHRNYNMCIDFGNKSCEMIANELMKEFALSSCSVLEDNENGAEVTLCDCG